MATLVDELVAAVTQPPSQHGRHVIVRQASAIMSRMTPSETTGRAGLALALSPVAMLLSGALKDQHSDHLAFAMQAVNNPSVLLADRLVYWPQFVLSWVWSLELAVRLDSMLRHFSLIFLSLWLVDLVRVVSRVSGKRLFTVGLLFVALWSMHWPEVGDSLYYSYAGIATLPLMILLGSPQRVLTSISARRALIATVIGASIAAMMNVLSLLVIAPLISAIHVIRQSPRFSHASYGLLGTRDVVGRNLLIGSTFGSLLGVLRLTISTSEDGGFTTFGLIERVRTTRHLWDGSLYLYDNIQVSAILVVLIVILAGSRRQWPLVALGAAGWVMTSSIVVITALEHVQANQLMPRYFSLVAATGLLLQILVVSAAVPLPTSSWQRKLTSRRAANPLSWLRQISHTIVALMFVSSLVIMFRTQIEFGRDYKDQSGGSKQAVVMNQSDVKRVQTELVDQSPVLLVANFWDAWPNAFLLQSVGVQVVVMENAPAYDERQKGFRDVANSGSLTMVCVLRDDAEGDCTDLVMESYQNHQLTPRSIKTIQMWTIERGSVAIMVSLQNSELAYHNQGSENEEKTFNENKTDDRFGRKQNT